MTINEYYSKTTARNTLTESAKHEKVELASTGRLRYGTDF